MDTTNTQSQPVQNIPSPVQQAPSQQPAPLGAPIATNPPPQPIQPTPPTPAPQQPTNFTTPPNSHSKLLIIGIVVLIIVLGALSYLLFMNSKTTQTKTAAKEIPTVAPSATSAPTPTPTPGLEEQAEAIETGNPEEDITELNTEIQGL